MHYPTPEVLIALCCSNGGGISVMPANVNFQFKQSNS